MGVSLDLEGCEPIGQHGLVGKTYNGLVTIGGPCGQGHVMSVAAADDLRAWLEVNISSYRNNAAEKEI